MSTSISSLPNATLTSPTQNVPALPNDPRALARQRSYEMSLERLKRQAVPAKTRGEAIKRSALDSNNITVDAISSLAFLGIIGIIRLFGKSVSKWWTWSAVLMAPALMLSRGLYAAVTGKVLGQERAQKLLALEAESPYSATSDPVNTPSLNPSAQIQSAPALTAADNPTPQTAGIANESPPLVNPQIPDTPAQEIPTQNPDVTPMPSTLTPDSKSDNPPAPGTPQPLRKPESTLILNA